MKLLSGFSAVAMLLLGCAAAQAGPIGPIEALPSSGSEYRVDVGGGYFFQGRRVRTTPQRYETTRNEVYGSIRYTGFDWSAEGRLGGLTLEETPDDPAVGIESRSEGFAPMVGLAVKALLHGDTSGDFAVGATVQANRLLVDMYQNYFNLGLAITAQQRWGGRATVYGGPFFSYGGGRRKGVPIDNTNVVPIRHARDTPLFGLVFGFHFDLPRSMAFEVEGQYTGLAGGGGVSAEVADWGVGAMLRVPLSP